MNRRALDLFKLEWSLLILLMMVILLYNFLGYSQTFIITNETIHLKSSYYVSSEYSDPKVPINQGTLVEITGLRLNKYFNFWYQLDNGGWVYAENVAPHQCESYVGGYCVDCGEEWFYEVEDVSATSYVVTDSSGAIIRSRPYSGESSVLRTEDYGTDLLIVGYIYNQIEKKCYQLNDGTWVFSESVTEKCVHSYTGGICNACGDEWPLSIMSMFETVFSVTKESGAVLRDRPYQDNSYEQAEVKQGSFLTVVASVTNQYGNVWYKTDEGFWIWSENVEECTHDYVRGVCSICEYQWLHTEMSFSEPTTCIVTCCTGTKIYEIPYTNEFEDENEFEDTSESEDVEDKNEHQYPMQVEQGATLIVEGYTINQKGNRWYKTFDCGWVNEEDVELYQER